MTCTDKIKELKGKRLSLLKKANKLTNRLEKEFKADKSDKTLTERIQSYTGRFYAVVGPVLKEAKDIQKVIDILVG